MRGSFCVRPEVAHHQKALAQGTDVAQIAAGNDHPVGDLPIELLDQLDGHSLLALEPQTVHRVGEVDGALLGNLLHQRHAAVKVRVETQHERAVGERLHELRRRDLVTWQQHDRRDASRRTVVRQGGGRVTRGRAGDRGDALSLGDHLLDDRHEDRHAEILE